MNIQNSAAVRFLKNFSGKCVRAAKDIVNGIRFGWLESDAAEDGRCTFFMFAPVAAIFGADAIVGHHPKDFLPAALIGSLALWGLKRLHTEGEWLRNNHYVP